jgi:hypothetical protein
VQLFPAVRAQSLPQPAVIHSYEVQPRKDKRGVDLISDALPFGGLWYAEPNAVGNAIDLRLARAYVWPLWQRARVSILHAHVALPCLSFPATS